MACAVRIYFSVGHNLWLKRSAGDSHSKAVCKFARALRHSIPLIESAALAPVLFEQHSIAPIVLESGWPSYTNDREQVHNDTHSPLYPYL